MDYLNEIKRRAEEEKRVLEMEMLRIQDDLRSERASRVEAEAREASLRSDFQRLSDHRSFDMRGSRCSPFVGFRRPFSLALHTRAGSVCAARLLIPCTNR